MSKQRVTYTWKIGTERDPESINEWLDAQTNIRDSLSFLVQIMQERFGNVDVRDIEVSKELIQFMNNIEAEDKSQAQKKVEQPPAAKQEKNSSSRTGQKEQKDDEDDDIFSGIDDKAIFTRR